MLDWMFSVCDVFEGETFDVENARSLGEARHLWHRHCYSSAVSDLSSFCISPRCGRYLATCLLNNNSCYCVNYGTIKLSSHDVWSNKQICCDN